MEELCDWSDICSGCGSCEKVCVLGKVLVKERLRKSDFFCLFVWNSPRVSKSPVPKCLWTFGGCSREPTWTWEESANSTPTRPSVAVTRTNLSLCWFKPAAMYIRTGGSDQSSVPVQVQFRGRVITEGSGVGKTMAQGPCRPVGLFNRACWRLKKNDPDHIIIMTTLATPWLLQWHSPGGALSTVAHWRDYAEPGLLFVISMLRC